MTTATTWHAESYFPNQGLNLSPLTWNLGALISGPPGKSPACIFNSPHSSDLCSITFPADLCVHGQRNNSMLSKEHTAGSSSLAGAHHLVNYRQVEVPAKGLSTPPVVSDESRYFVLDAGYEYNLCGVFWLLNFLWVLKYVHYITAS